MKFKKTPVRTCLDKFLLITVTALSMLTVLAQAQVASKKKRVGGQPNIVFIMSDDHSYQTISAYGGAVSKLAPTPNIDKIASGESFTVRLLLKILFVRQAGHAS